jgi:hypothetical protein
MSIESKDILALCDRFEPFLVPLEIHVLRRRYNGQTFLSTYAVAREMGISDETVRTIENRALASIAYCLDLEANGQDITPMRPAKSFWQPVASMLCDGSEPRPTAATYTAHRGELIIFASSLVDQPGRPLTPFTYARPGGLPRGAIIGRCLLVDCYRAPLPQHHPHQWEINLERPETFPEPISYKGQPSYFSINNEVAQQLPPRDSFSF